MAKLLQEWELHAMYDESIDETCPLVCIGSLTYDASSVLKSVDPVAYRVGFSDWLDAEVSDGILFEHDGEYYDGEPCLHESTENGVCIDCGEVV